MYRYLLLGVKGRRVETWNMISLPSNSVYTLYRPVESSETEGKTMSNVSHFNTGTGI
jgi:hypothetical protein